MQKMDMTKILEDGVKQTWADNSMEIQIQGASETQLQSALASFDLPITYSHAPDHIKVIIDMPAAKAQAMANNQIFEAAANLASGSEVTRRTCWKIFGMGVETKIRKRLGTAVPSHHIVDIAVNIQNLSQQ